MGKVLIIFDIDGTLIDSVILHQSAFKKALYEFGFPVFNDNWNEYLHHTDSYIFKTIFEAKNGIKSNPSDIERFEKILTQTLSDSIKEKRISEIKGANDFLHKLTNQFKFDIAFATGSLKNPAILKLSNAGLVIDQSLISSSNSVYSREEIIEEAIALAKTKYHKTEYDTIFSFGDGKWDYEAARNLNLNFVGINDSSLIELGISDFFSDYTNDSVLKFLLKKVSINFNITSSGRISNAFIKAGIWDFMSAREFIKQLSYGRNHNKKDLLTIFEENCGTCSTKHALLKQLADENGCKEVKLMLGLFYMNSENTPEVANTLTSARLICIPEAHCYLKTQYEVIDVTKPDSSPVEFVKDLIEETEIQTNQITGYKVRYHKNYLIKWLNENPEIPYSIDELWQIREKCILNLGNNNKKSNETGLYNF